jgi:hypothetical protein
MLTSELSRRTGIPESSIKLWVSQGILRPAYPGRVGRGNGHEYSEDNVQQALAIQRVRAEFGDGAAARRTIAEAIPLVKAGVEWIDIPKFDLALT